MSNAPRTYSQAAKIAEEVTLEEFAALVATDDNLDVYPGPRKTRRIAMGARFRNWDQDPGLGTIVFDYCNRNGFTRFGCVTAGFGHNPPIFHSDRLDRTVIVQSYTDRKNA